MMIATWRGTGPAPVAGSAFARARLGARHLLRISFSLASAASSISLIVSSVSFCTSMLEPLALVLADLVLLLVLLEMVHAVAADVAHRDPRLFGILADQLGQFLAPLLGQIRDRQADHLAVGDRVDAQIGVADRFFDRRDIRFVPHLHADTAAARAPRRSRPG